MNYTMEELIPIVAELAGKYTGCDSTSVTYEKAQSLMNGVLYCLNECQQSTRYGLTAHNLPVSEQYRIGARLVLEKASAIQEIYNTIALSFDSYGMKCLYDTVQKGIPEFLKWYDAKFCPQDTILALDYPLLTNIRSLSGADAVYAYISAIRTEQKFLHRFDRYYVTSLLESVNPNYRYMVENICDIVLTNTLGHMVLRKPLQDQGFSEADYRNLSSLFSLNYIGNIEAKLRQLTEALVHQLYNNDPELLSYLCCAIPDMAVRIDNAVKNGQPDKLFLL